MKKPFLILAAFTLLAAACSSTATVDTTDDVAAAPADDGSGDDGSGASGSTNSTDDPPADAQPTEAAAVEPTSTPAQTNDDEGNTTSGTLDELPEFLVGDDWCNAASFIEDNFAGLENVDFTNPRELEQSYTRSLQLITRIAAIAPPEISADVDMTIEGFTTLTSALEEVEWSFLDLDLSVIDSLEGGMDLATYNIENYNFTVCGIGDDPGEPPVPTSDAPTDDDDSRPPPVDGTIREQAVAGLVAAGFTQEEAECIFAGMDVTNPEALADTAGLLALFTDCGISLDRLSQLGG